MDTLRNSQRTVSGVLELTKNSLRIECSLEKSNSTGNSSKGEQLVYPLVVLTAQLVQVVDGRPNVRIAHHFFAASGDQAFLIEC